MARRLIPLYLAAMNEIRGGGALQRFLEAIASAASSASGSDISYQTIDVSGAGTITLSEGDIRSFNVGFTGVLTGNRTIVVPSTPGLSWSFQNITVGPYILRVSDGANTFPLAPSQTKRFWGTDPTVPDLQVDDPSMWFLRFRQSLVGAVGNVDTLIARAPSPIVIRSANIFVETAPVGGASTLSLGVSSGGSEILLATASGGAGTVIGEDPDELGADMSTDGSATYTTDQTIYLRNAIAGSPITAGSVVVTLIGEIKGVL